METRAADRWGQHLVLVGVVLALEELPAGQADDARGDSVGDELLMGLDGQRDLAAGRDQDHLGVALGVGEHIAAAAQPIGRGVLRAVQDRDVLAGENERHRLVVAVHRRPPGLGDLVGVGGANHVQTRDRPQRGELLHRLVGRAVLAEADRVVREEMDDRQLHQGGEPDRRARVVGEGQVGGPQRPHLREREPVRDRGGLVLADAVVELAPLARFRLEGLAALELDGVRAGQVGRARHQPGNPGRDGVLDLVRGLPRRGALLVRLEARDVGVPALRELAALHRLPVGGLLGVVGRGSSRRAPSTARSAPPRACPSPRRSAPGRRRGPGTRRPRASRRSAWSPGPPRRRAARRAPRPCPACVGAP